MTSINRIIDDYWTAFNHRNIDTILSNLDKEINFYSPSYPCGTQGKIYVQLFLSELFINSSVSISDKIVYTLSERETRPDRAVASGIIKGKIILPEKINSHWDKRPTQSFRLWGATYFRINMSDGLISELHTYWDLYTFLHQDEIKLQNYMALLPELSSLQNG